MTDEELMRRALCIASGGVFYVEARVGSDNHRGECCRAITCGSRCNDSAEVLLMEFAKRFVRSQIPT